MTRSIRASVPGFALALWWLALVLGVVTLARADTRETMAKNFAEFERFAGEPVGEIRNFRLYRWRPLGVTALAVWADPGRVFLLTVDAPCDDLEYAKVLQVSSTTRIVAVRTDRILVGNDDCRIASIRPVDYRALQRARRGEE